MIRAIGQWVLRRACHDAAALDSDIKIAVNLSPSQFKDKTLLGYIQAALAASGLPANRLELEITESVLLTDSNIVLAILLEIKALGVQIFMDDFGTGYSSLSYLRSLPFDKVKIDRSFIKDLPNDKNAMAIIRAIVGLSETFGMTVTAEGVETNEQAVLLALEDCTHLQGYLFSTAVPAGDIPTLIEHFSRFNCVRRLTTSRCDDIRVLLRRRGSLLRQVSNARGPGYSPRGLGSQARDNDHFGSTGYDGTAGR